jgi:hypothetical protein
MVSGLGQQKMIYRHAGFWRESAASRCIGDAGKPIHPDGGIGGESFCNAMDDLVLLPWQPPASVEALVSRIVYLSEIRRWMDMI